MTLAKTATNFASCADKNAAARLVIAIAKKSVFLGGSAYSGFAQKNSRFCAPSR